MIWMTSGSDMALFLTSSGSVLLYWRTAHSLYPKREELLYPVLRFRIITSSLWIRPAMVFYSTAGGKKVLAVMDDMK